MNIYIVYKTTNKVNNKFYIGVHNNTKPNYLGSGPVLNSAIKKYGTSNFVRETLYEFNTKEMAYQKEKELISEELINSPNCYNVKQGGLGGGNGGHIPNSKTRKKMSETRKRHCWINNGVENSMVDKSLPLPDGWVKGRIKFNPVTTKGSKWYTDGINSILLKPSDIVPEGFYRGRIKP